MFLQFFFFLSSKSKVEAYPADPTQLKKSHFWMLHEQLDFLGDSLAHRDVKTALSFNRRES
jgi:hypothetical protein